MEILSYAFYKIKKTHLEIFFMCSVKKNHVEIILSTLKNKQSSFEKVF